MTSLEAEALRLLAAGPATGASLVAAGGRLRAWNVYGVLARLEERGLVTSREIGEPAWPDGPRQRVYEAVDP